MRATILLSGGIDSMACAHFYLQREYDVCALFFNYGQSAYNAEKESAYNISSFLRIPLQIIELPRLHLQKTGCYISRNALFVLHALSCNFGKTDKIALGIHDGTNYGDCSLHFIDSIQAIIDIYSNGTVICEAPFVSWYKPDIIQYARENHLPLNMTYSCELGCIPACGRCASCMDRKGVSENE